MIRMLPFLRTISEDTGLSEEDIRKVLESTFSHIEKYASIGEEVSITGFGKFLGDIKVPRLLKNYLSKGKTVMTKGRITVKFHHYDSNRKELWSNSSHAKAFEGDQKC